MNHLSVLASCAFGAVVMLLGSSMVLGQGKPPAPGGQRPGFVSVRTSTTDTTLTVSDEVLVVDAGETDALTVALPLASSLSGKVFTIKNSGGADVITLQPQGGEEVDADGPDVGVVFGTFDTGTASAVTVVSDGSNWWVISGRVQ